VRLFLLDNYDSFTWNLAHYFEELGATVDVELNDRTSVATIREHEYDAWVISPGPGRPEQAGISLDLVRAAGEEQPLLGVCLGHQALARAHGARIVRAPTLMHGKTSEVLHDGTGLFEGIDVPCVAMRYHSLVVDPASIPERLEVTAGTAEGVVMAIRYRGRPHHGIQFHPESIMTAAGKRLLANFLALARRSTSAYSSRM